MPVDIRSPLWFLVFTKPSGEQTAQANLERQGYRVYFPRLARTGSHRGRVAERIVPLFPRYLFVQMDPIHQSLAPVRSTVGVARIVRFGGDATVVPDAIVTRLIERADPESGLHRLACEHRFERGAPVRLTAGVFANLEGIFECEIGNDRSIVLLDLLGKCTSVHVPLHFIEPGAATGHGSRSLHRAGAQLAVGGPR